jgi:hypothetical protein
MVKGHQERIVELEVEVEQLKSHNRQLVEIGKAMEKIAQGFLYWEYGERRLGTLVVAWLGSWTALTTPTAQKAQDESRVLEAAKVLHEASLMSHWTHCPIAAFKPGDCNCGLAEFDQAVEALDESRVLEAAKDAYQSGTLSALHYKLRLAVEALLKRETENPQGGASNALD